MTTTLRARRVFRLALSLVAFMVVGSAHASNSSALKKHVIDTRELFPGDCPKLEFLDTEESSQTDEQLTYASQETHVTKGKRHVWTTRVASDLDWAEFQLTAQGNDPVTAKVCVHSLKDGKETNSTLLGEVQSSKGKRVSRYLTHIKDLYLSVRLSTNSRDGVTSTLRLKRKNQGDRLRWSKTTKAKYADIPEQGGFADLHNHQAADLAHGGAFGDAYVHGPHDAPLYACGGEHTGLVGSFEGTRHPEELYHEPGAWWPHASDGSHMQTHVDQLKKAHEDGLRLLLATAVSNEALCVLSAGLGKKHSPFRCADMDSAVAQIRAFHEFEKKHSDWYAIARDPWEARKFMSEGKLAVVLGVEVSNLMPPQRGAWREQLDELYDMGVRSVELAHEVDSIFSGSAHQHSGMFHLLNGLVGEESSGGDDVNDGGSREKEKSEGSKKRLKSLARSVIKSFQNRTNDHCLRATDKKQDGDEDFIKCNEFGLKPEGRELVHELIDRRMFLPLDHLSRHARQDVYDIVEKRGFYPVFASHTRPDALMHPKERSKKGTNEYMLDDYDLSWVKKTGGMIGLRTGDNATLEIPGCLRDANNDPMPVTCWGSSESLAQNICYGADLEIAMALGTDFSGPVSMTAPRQSHANPATHRLDGLPAACPRNVELGFSTPFGYRREDVHLKPDDYSGRHDDYRVRGLAHTGQSYPLLKEMQDMKAPLAETGMWRSAENFLLMWQRMYDVAAACPRNASNADCSGELSEEEYRERMIVKKIDYPSRNAPPEYDVKRRKHFKRCLRWKENGSMRCDDMRDWERRFAVPPKGGCGGCETLSSRTPSTAPWMLLLLLAAVIRRRRARN